jgi:hypothetical protein
MHSRRAQVKCEVRVITNDNPPAKIKGATKWEHCDFLVS